jgi:hypothetical protein
MRAEKKAGKHFLVRPDLRDGMTEEEEAEATRQAAEEMHRAVAAQASRDGGGDQVGMEGGDRPSGFRVNAGFLAWKASSEAAYAGESLRILEGAVERRERSLALWLERLVGTGPDGRERLEKELAADPRRRERVKQELARREAEIEEARERFERGRKLYERANRAWLRAHVIARSCPRFDEGARHLAAEEFHRAQGAAEEISRLLGRSREPR